MWLALSWSCCGQTRCEGKGSRGLGRRRGLRSSRRERGGGGHPPGSPAAAATSEHQSAHISIRQPTCTKHIQKFRFVVNRFLPFLFTFSLSEIPAKKHFYHKERRNAQLLIVSEHLFAREDFIYHLRTNELIHERRTPLFMDLAVITTFVIPAGCSHKLCDPSWL